MRTRITRPRRRPSSEGARGCPDPARHPGPTAVCCSSTRHRNTNAGSWTRSGSRWRAGSWYFTVRQELRRTLHASSWFLRPTPVRVARQRARGSTASAPQRCAGATWRGCPGRCWTGWTSSCRSSGCRLPTLASPRPRRIPPPSRPVSRPRGNASWSGCCRSAWRPTPRCPGGCSGVHCGSAPPPRGSWTAPWSAGC